jgi:hypothetical protein
LAAGRTFFSFIEVNLSKADFALPESDLSNPESGVSSRHRIVIAGGTFNATGRMHGASIETGSSGITGPLSKGDEICIKNTSSVASSQPGTR